MKAKYILFLVCLLGATGGLAQNKLFDKYADMDGVTSVYISKAMFNMMPVMETAGLNLMNMKGKIESLQLVSTSKKEIGERMRKEFTKLISGGHEELMRVRKDKTKATFYAEMKGESVKELLMLADTDNQFTVILLTGNFTLQDVRDITKDMHE